MSSTVLARPRQRWTGLAVLVLAVTLVAVDATVLSLAIPSISETLRPSGTQLLWIGDAYSFVLAGLLVSMGSLSDRIGRKKLLLAGSSAFGAASLLAAYAPSAGWLILARALLGVAGATIMPSTLSLIRSLFPDDRERATAIGIWGAAATAGAALGPVVGGVLLEHFWWGSVFLLNIPVLVLLLVLGAWLLPESKDPKPGRWDVLSVLLSLAGVIGVVYAIKEAAAHGVARWDVPVAAVLGAAALTVFVRRQLRLPAPLLDVRLFADRRFTGAVLASLTALIGLSGVVFVTSQYLQLVRGYEPLKAGLAELPAFAGAVVGGLLTARLARRTGARAALTLGLLAMGIGLGLIGWVHQDTTYLLLAAAFLIVGTAEESSTRSAPTWSWAPRPPTRRAPPRPSPRRRTSWAPRSASRWSARWSARCTRAHWPSRPRPGRWPPPGPASHSAAPSRPRTACPGRWPGRCSAAPGTPSCTA